MAQSIEKESKWDYKNFIMMSLEVMKMNEKEAYYRAFNRISEIIEELQKLQEEMEELVIGAPDESEVDPQ